MAVTVMHISSAGLSQPGNPPLADGLPPVDLGSWNTLHPEEKGQVI